MRSDGEEAGRLTCLKIDVDTHDGMRDGVPHLLDALREARLRATFFLSFGPDKAGRAILELVRQRGFLKTMLATGAPRRHGWRTIVSGTLLPARAVACAFPDLVRRIVAEGHEAAVHAWDHRLWQAHLPELDETRVRSELDSACEAFERVTGERPAGLAAPAWFATRTSLRVQDSLGLLYASDMRGGPPCYPELKGYVSTTLQIPTTQQCLEELLARGTRDPERCLDAVTATPDEPLIARVIPLHAEVEGGLHRPFLRRVLGRLTERRDEVVPLRDLAQRLLRQPDSIPVLSTHLTQVPGRAGRVLAPRATAYAHA